jgi:hypothetical protein
LGDAIPDVLDELQALGDGQIAVIESRFGHGINLERKGARRKMCAPPPNESRISCVVRRPQSR